jgi:hypothetical protein
MPIFIKSLFLNLAVENIKIRSENRSNFDEYMHKK